jgi:hypothetical protein
VSLGRRRLARVLAVLALALPAWLHAAGPARRDADILKQKVALIVQAASAPRAQPHRVTVTENEVNAYLAYDARPDLPVGVVNPVVTILGTGRLAGRAVVDLDAVRQQQNPTSLFDPTAYLSGHLPVSVTGVLKTSSGTGRFELESATIGGVPVPKFVLQQIVSFYSRTPETPAGINLDDPFELPARIREIQVERGQAIIVQ